MKDDDYTREGISMMVNWTNKFSNDKTTIKTYRVYISTTPEGMVICFSLMFFFTKQRLNKNTIIWQFIFSIGHDVWDSGEDLPNTETTYLVRSLSLLPGVRYFVNVIAYGFSGIHHTESSDGFVIDNTRPIAGVVFDGIGILVNTRMIHVYRFYGFGPYLTRLLLFALFLQDCMIWNFKTLPV